ncbi:unnamed protein product [Amoebophrya sp. A120]|nr:unnamed protein product [Amoebophrya sp. A120]|eukprot:GSA120T00023159001.1
MTNNQSEKVVRAFDYSKFNNIDISDDEDNFHPNIEKNFNIRINKEVRGRKINEMDMEKEELKKKDDEKSKKRLQELERKQIWHAGNMCEVKEEKTHVGTYGRSDPKRDILPGKEEGMNDAKDLDEYMVWKGQNQKLLDELVDAGGNMTRTQQLLEKEGDKLVTQDFANTYLMLACLEFEMEGNRKRSYKCAQQSQLLTHVKELAKSFGRPPRDIVTRWFQKVADNEDARKIWEADVDGFAKRVQERAVEKKKEEAEEKLRKREEEEKYVATHWKRKDQIDAKEEEDEEYEIGEAVPMVEAMKQMTKQERIEMAPGGLDPLEVFEELPQEMRRCFESQDTQMLVDLQKTMDPAIFNPHLIKCIKAGLWSQPMGDDSDDEKEEEEPKIEVLESSKHVVE